MPRHYQCTGCERKKPRSAFYIRDGRPRRRCKECMREYRFLKRYGITATARDLMARQQGGCCAICGDLPPGDVALHLDHDHVTGKPRGLLCLNCNHLLGKARDAPRILERAIAYLEEHTK